MNSDAFSRYHPAVSFAFFAGAIGFGVVFLHPAYLLAGAVSGSVYFLILGGGKNARRLLGMLPLCLLLALFNPLFNTQGEHVLLTLFGRPYTLEALLYGGAVAAIFLIMLLWFGCYSAVVTSDKFLCLFGGLAPSLSLLLVMVLRLIPGLLQRTRRISGARRAIGKGPGVTRTDALKNGAEVLSALTSWSLESSVVTADSMRARGYGTGKRTSFQLYRFTRRDGVLLTILGLLALAVVLNAASGGVSVRFLPNVSAAPARLPGLIAYWLYLLTPPALAVQDRLSWRVLRARR